MKKVEKKDCVDHYKLWIDDDHSLQLKDFETNDSGIYICKSRNAGENDPIFTYVLDGKMNQFHNCLLLYIHFIFST